MSGYPTKTAATRSGAASGQTFSPSSHVLRIPLAGAGYWMCSDSEDQVRSDRPHANLFGRTMDYLVRAAEYKFRMNGVFLLIGPPTRNPSLRWKTNRIFTSILELRRQPSSKISRTNPTHTHARARLLFLIFMNDSPQQGSSSLPPRVRPSFQFVDLIMR